MSTRAALALALGHLLWMAPVALVARDGRSIAIVLDTSRSMRDNDPARYNIQLTQILSDLLDDQDQLTVITMPGWQWSCSAGPSANLATRLDAGNRMGFKRHLDQTFSYDTGTFFAAPIHTAIEVLEGQPGRPRMLLILADAGGLGDCHERLTRELQALRREGVFLSAINLDATTGAFEGNPAFDFTTSARDSRALVEAVGLVYQRFLGASKVQTGDARGSFSVEISPLAREAFLVVAADGPVGELASDPANPGAAALDLDFRGGSRTRGLDGVDRGYRIARLSRPQGGRWTFRVRDLVAPAGYLLIQDLSSVGARLRSSGVIARGVATTLEVELFDRETGRAIADPRGPAGLTATLQVEGRPVRFTLDDEGRLRATVTFGGSGRHTLQGRLTSDLLDVPISWTVDIADRLGSLEVRTPATATLETPVTLEVATEDSAKGGKGLDPPRQVEAVIEGTVVATLRDEGGPGDQAAGDGVFSARYTPQILGRVEILYRPVGSDLFPPVQAPLEVGGILELAPPPPIDLGAVGGGSQTPATLDLSGTEVVGRFTIEVRSSGPELPRALLELDPGGGWMALGSRPVPLVLEGGGPRSFPLRLRVGSCPPALPATTLTLELSAVGADGQPTTVRAPLRLEILPDPWLHCWWPILAALGGVLATAFVIHGFWSPSRFRRGVGVMLSAEEDILLGFFYPIRPVRGSGSGFYRDARVFVRPDFRLSGRARGALARLRADGPVIRLRPMDGMTLERRTADGSWEPVPTEESILRTGQVIRSLTKNLFFALRHG